MTLDGETYSAISAIGRAIAAGEIDRARAMVAAGNRQADLAFAVTRAKTDRAHCWRVLGLA